MEKNRVISALVLIPILISFIHFTPAVLFLLLIEVVGLIALSEYHRIVLPNATKNDKIFGYVLNFLLIGAVYCSEYTHASWDIFQVTLAAFFLVVFYHITVTQGKEYSQLMDSFSRVLLGVVYCAVLPSFIVLIRLNKSVEFIYLLLISIWAVDTFAYQAGRSFGKIKLLPKISPKKTWAGSAGGFLGAILVICVGKYIYFSEFSYLQAITLGILVSFTAQVGDLFESLLKRAGGIKDSGNLIPGHGGLLDRIDSLLFAAPIYYYFITNLNL